SAVRGRGGPGTGPPGGGSGSRRGQERREGAPRLAAVRPSRGETGQNVGLLLRGIKADQVRRGQVIAAPRTTRPRPKFKGEVCVLSGGEGGRHTPFSSGYRPQFFSRTTNVTGEVRLPDGTEMVLPGDNAAVAVLPDKPVAPDVGSHFAI